MENNLINGSQPKEKQIKTLSRRQKRNLFYAAMVFLPLVQVFIFYFVVNFNSIMFAFQSYTTLGGYTFVGFDNFTQIFHDIFNEPKLAYSFQNSTVLYLCTLVVGSGGAILFSNYIYKKYLGHKFFRITLFLPNIVSGVVLATSYRFMLQRGIDDIYYRLTGVTLGSLMENQRVEFYYYLVFYLWFSFGTQVLMYTSTMSGISTEIVESAQLDGITPMRELVSITVPMIYSTVVSFVTIGIAGFFTNQMMLYTFKEAGAGDHLYNFGYYIYVQTKSAAYKYDYDMYTYLSALGLCMTAVAAPVTIGIRKLLEKYGPSED